MRSFTSGRRNSPLYKYPDQIMRVGRMGVTQLQLLLGGREGGNFAPLASARFNCYQSELFQRSGPHFSFRLDASFGAYVCVCVVCLPIHDTDQGEPGLPSKSPNRHHSTCPFWHQRRHCQSVSQSSNLSRLTRARILRQPNVGKRKRDAAAKMGKQECKTKMAGQPLLRVFTRQSAQPRSLSGLLHS